MQKKARVHIPTTVTDDAAISEVVSSEVVSS
jgi:hypothetical protein